MALIAFCVENFCWVNSSGHDVFKIAGTFLMVFVNIFLDFLYDYKEKEFLCYFCL